MPVVGQQLETQPKGPKSRSPVLFGALAAVLLGLLHLGVALMPAPPFSGPMNFVLFATNLYVIYCAVATLRERSGLAVVGFIAGYALLYLLTMVVLGKASLFILLVVLYASVFGSPGLLGLLALFVCCFVLFQPYGFETFIPLGLTYALLWRARGRSSRFVLLCLAAGLLALFLVLLPLIHLSLQDSVQTLWLTLGREDVRRALGLSLASSSIATAVCVLFGVPLAYALARLDFAGKPLLETLIDVPILVPQSVVGIAFIVMLGPGSPLGQWLEGHGWHISGSLVGLVLAQVFVAAPFVIKAAHTAFDGVPVPLEQAARVLGSSAAMAFVKIAVPLASRGLLVGAVLGWARALSEFGAIILFASSPVTAPVLVHTEFLRAGVTESRPIATLLLVTCFWAFLLLRLGAGYLPFGWRPPRPGGAA